MPAFLKSENCRVCLAWIFMFFWATIMLDKYH